MPNVNRLPSSIRLTATRVLASKDGRGVTPVTATQCQEIQDRFKPPAEPMAKDALWTAPGVFKGQVMVRIIDIGGPKATRSSKVLGAADC